MPKRRAMPSKPRGKKVSPKSEPPLGWEDELVSQLRRLIVEADPAAVEEQKWRKPSNPDGVPVWYQDGIVCMVGILKNRVRITFPEGASLDDPKGLFNAALEAGHMRGIDIWAGDKVDAAGIKTLVRASVALNVASKRAHG
jgi:hypothetical protein